MKKFVALGFSAVLTACGGGSGGGQTSTDSPQLVGTAATGAALANASVSIQNSVNNSPCVEASIVTSALGSYTCTLKAGELAPFFVVVTDPTGATEPLISIATTTPTAGTPLTVNATPLTTAIVAQLNGGNAQGVIDDKAKYVAANFINAKTNVLAQIRQLLTSIDAPDNYDPFTTSITAATTGQVGNTADLVLDVIKITKTQAGALAFSTIEAPTPILIATADTSGIELPTPTDSVSDLSRSAQLAAKAFKSCFDLPVAQRVTLSDGAITSVASACQDMVTSANVPTGAPAFKSNGYSAEQVFYKFLTNNAMTGAKFSVPEIIAFYPVIENVRVREAAVINIRFIDNLGIPGNFITVAQNFPGSSSASRLSNWWITGNQKDIDIHISTSVRRTEKSAPNMHSDYRNGLAIYINGVNSGNNAAPNSSFYDSVLVTGNGLPTTGLWYFRQSNSDQLVMATQRSAPPVTTFTEVCSACSTFWISRTRGLTGDDASNYRTNITELNWAQGNDGSYVGTSGTRPTKGSIYTFALYKNGALYKTETRTLLTDLTDAIREHKMPWHGIGMQTTAALDPTDVTLNGTMTSLPIDWALNPSAEQIKSIWVSMTNGGFDNHTALVLGASSVIATPAPGTTFTALTGPNLRDNPNNGVYSGYREVGFNYRMLNGSSKQAIYTYSP